MESIGFLLDPYCIALYRWTGVPILDYLVGTFLLALLCVVIGEFTLSMVYRKNRHYLLALQTQMTNHHNLSLDALRGKDKAGYKACNEQANEAHGKVFFNMVTLSAASLWPAFFALAWMQYRFDGVTVRIPGVDLALGYPAVFILLYILARILFKHAKPHLPYFRGVQEMLLADRASVGHMRSLQEAFPNTAGTAGRADRRSGPGGP